MTKVEDYGNSLNTLFKELFSYWEEKGNENISYTSEESLSNSVLPVDSQSQISFFAIPESLLPFYKSNIFPVFVEKGFIPISLDDVILKHSNFDAAIISLIGKSSVIVFDALLSSPNLEYFLRLTSQIKGKDFAFIVVETEAELKRLKIDRTSFPVFNITRKKNIDPEGSSDIIYDFISILEAISKTHQVKLSNEPQRLLMKGEYKAAVIAAFSLFEVKLRKTIESIQPYRGGLKIYSVRQLLDIGQVFGIVSTKIQKDALDWVAVRNRLIHDDMQITKSKSVTIVEAIVQAIEEIQSIPRVEVILNQRDRYVLGTRFLSKLCELDKQDPNGKFTKEQIWKDNLGAFAIEVVYPLVLNHFKHSLKYVEVDKDDKISLTQKGRDHCGQDVTLPESL